MALPAGRIAGSRRLGPSIGLQFAIQEEISIIAAMDDQQFQSHSEPAMDALKRSLIEAEESADIEVEDQSGALHISFDDGNRFVISPNSPARQIWISALATSFKLDWSEPAQAWILSKSGETLKDLVARLINQQLGENLVSL
jgi:iron donor protein CyaY